MQKPKAAVSILHGLRPSFSVTGGFAKDERRDGAQPRDNTRSMHAVLHRYVRVSVYRFAFPTTLLVRQQLITRRRKADLYVSRRNNVSSPELCI